MRELQEQGTLAVPATIENRIPTLEMREPTADTNLAYAVVLLKHYGFELRGYTAQELVERWVKTYSPHWVRLGVIEALYQGRYKAVSVEQILAVWARRGQPIHRFNHEFERLISRKLPQKLVGPPDVRSPFGQCQRELLSQFDYDSEATLCLPESEQVSAEPLASTLLLNADRELAIMQQLVEASPLSLASDSAQPPLEASSPLPEPNPEASLPLVTANFPDTTDLSSQESTEHEPLLMVQQETDPPTEELSETTMQWDDSGKKTQTDISVRTTYDANWSRCEVNKQPIHQFIPPPDSSGFYLKLKAVVCQQEEIPPKIALSMTEVVETQPSSSDS